ncbi:hypothetical protein ACD661_08610 [Legionella lytica]|uniref:HEAT repeat protein n=1 Tax=Legionella lytica TaxID=96232 RepID=A0ABW8D7E3_9GAMM
MLSLIKIEKIHVLLQQYNSENSDPYSPLIIQELQKWIDSTQTHTDNTIIDSQLGSILIHNYLKPSDSQAAFAFKIAFPSIFQKQELKKILKSVALSQIEKGLFSELYLQNLIEVTHTSRITGAANFFAPDNHRDVQGVVLKTTPSRDLIKIIATNNAFYTHILEILFERQDKAALRFQAQTLRTWCQQLGNEENILAQWHHFSADTEQWVNRLKNCLRWPETSLVSKVHCIRVLQCFGNMSQEITNDFWNAVEKIQTLPLVQLDENEDDAIGLNLLLKDVYERRKDVWEDALTPVPSSPELVLEQMEADNEFETLAQESDYTRLILIAAKLDEQQLNRALVLCLNNASIERNAPNTASDVFCTLVMTHKSHFPDALMQGFLKTINATHLSTKEGRVTDRYSFNALILLATNNSTLLNALTEIIFLRMRHPDPQVRASVYCLDKLDLFVSGLPEIKEELITNLIQVMAEQPHVGTVKSALKSAVKKLSVMQLAKYIQRYFPALSSDNKEEKIKAINIIAELAAPLSPCPDDIILKLIALSKNVDNEVSFAAFTALKSLKPHLLLLKKGMINEMLKAGHDDYRFTALIELAPLMSTTDFTDDLILNLINSIVHYEDDAELKLKALSLLVPKLSESQLDAYVALCLQELQNIKWLSIVPVSMFNGQLEAFIKKHQELLKNPDVDIREQIFGRFLMIFSVAPVRPSGRVLVDCIKMLENEDFVYEVEEVIPQVMHLVADEYVNEVYELFIALITDNVGSSDLMNASLNGLTKLVPRLSQEQLTRMKIHLIEKLDERNPKVFDVLTRMARYFHDEELSSLIIVLAGEVDVSTSKYLRNIAHLITNDSLEQVLTSQFRDIDDTHYKLCREACLTLSAIAPHATSDGIEQIISCFIQILADEPHALRHISGDHPGYDIAINGLIRLADEIKQTDLEQILNLPEINFSIIALKYILKAYTEYPANLCAQPNI